MKRKLHFELIFLFIFFFLSKSFFGQGRIVINEFMPWSGCSTTSEFIELMNFGPGPMNIGCYIVTNGTYSVTIPPNTILQPRQYFVLSGQNTLTKGCGNTDSSITVDLNWTTCNCTNTTIPTTGDGFLQNGGNANEKVVLLDPDLNIVDAVTRSTPVSASVSITTPTLSGGCSSKTFNLSTMNVNYESIGSSTGIDNSFARKVDGDCGWIKTTAISADAPNKTGSTSSATYSFSTLSASDCQSTQGSISIQVTANDVNSLFPMNYTLAYDVDSNNLFNSIDQYTNGSDNTAPTIDINNLIYGRYRITVASSSSCNLKTYDFYIFNCYGVVLPIKIPNFKYEGIQQNVQAFKYAVSDLENLKEVVLEGSNSNNFETVKTIKAPFDNTESEIKIPLSTFSFFRLRIKDKSDHVSYSNVIKVNAIISSGVKHWPNPVQDKIFAEMSFLENGKTSYSIFNSNGVKLKEGLIDVKTGTQTITLPVENLKPGLYYLKMTSPSNKQIVSFCFVK